jgi:hypothetical protein
LKTYTIFDTIRSVFDKSSEMLGGTLKRKDKARSLLTKIVNALTAKLEIGDEQDSRQLEHENPSASKARPVCTSILEGDHIILHSCYALLIPLHEGNESEQQEEAELDPGVEKQMQHIGQTVPEKQWLQNGGGDSGNAPAASRHAAGSYSPTGQRYIPNRWTSWSLNQKFGFQQHPDHDSPVVVDLKVRGLLNEQIST